MKSKILLGLFVCLLMGAACAQAAEPWKGTPLNRGYSVGFLGGLGLIEPHYGAAITGHVAKTLLDGGFVPDVNNPILLELEAGPFFVAGQSPLFVGTHLRWDWIYNDTWTVFAMGGLGFQFAGAPLGDRSLLFARFGGGAFYHLLENMSLRMEVSHEITGVGLTFDF